MTSQTYIFIIEMSKKKSYSTQDVISHILATCSDSEMSDLT